MDLKSGYVGLSAACAPVPVASGSSSDSKHEPAGAPATCARCSRSTTSRTSPPSTCRGGPMARFAGSTSSSPRGRTPGSSSSAQASTAWLARRATQVHSVEHDEGFAEVVRRLVAAHPAVQLHVVPAPRVARGTAAVPSRRRGYADCDFADYVATVERVGGAFDPSWSTAGRGSSACAARCPSSRRAGCWCSTTRTGGATGPRSHCRVSRLRCWQGRRRACPTRTPRRCCARPGRRRRARRHRRDRPRRRRRVPRARGTALLRLGFVLAAIGLAIAAVVRDRAGFADAVGRVGLLRSSVALLAVIAGLLASAQVWRAAMASFGARLTTADAGRMFFLTQVGKYLPGSVWPLLAQMELARRRGMPRALAGVAGVLFLAVHGAHRAGRAVAVVGARRSRPLPVAARGRARPRRTPGACGSDARGRARPPGPRRPPLPRPLSARDVVVPVAWMTCVWAAYSAAAGVVAAPLRAPEVSVGPACSSP